MRLPTLLPSGLLAIGLALGPTSGHGYTLTTFSQSVFDPDTGAMDAALGITGMSIEDFSDTTLIPGLAIRFANPDGGPLETLPANFTFLAEQAWDNPDAPSFLINRPDQLNQAPFSDTTFIISGGTTRFGIGLSNFQTFLNETDLIVNGVNFGRVSDLPNYVDGGPSIRNLYLLVSMDAGDGPITTVTFDNLDTIDAHLFDHLAIDAAAVPLPPALYLLLTAAGLCVGRAKRRGTRTANPHKERVVTTTAATLNARPGPRRARRPLATFVLASAAAAPASAATVTFTDGTFADPDWSATKLQDTTAGATATFAAGQVASGGNPDAYRQVQHVFDAGVIGVGHLKASAAFDPALAGAIASIAYGYDLIHLAPPPAQAVAYGILLQQDGAYYRSAFDTIFPEAWTAFGASGLTAANFSLIAGTGPASPDFTAGGAPITFGYVSFNNNTGGAPDLVRLSGIDNWQVSVTTVPLPPAAWLLATGLAGIVLRGVGAARRDRGCPRQPTST